MSRRPVSIPLPSSSSSSSSFALRWSLLVLAVSASAAVACGGDGATTATGAPEPTGAAGSTAAPSGEAGSSGASTGEAGSAGNTDAGAAGAAATSEDDLKANDPGVGFTADFRTYLSTLEGDLGTADVGGPAGYGGRTKAGQKLKHKPLILVHGNSDQAVGGKLGGWSGVIDGFKKAGYTSAEIYAVSWGPADSYQAVYQYHSRAYLERIRGFIQAVLAYTGADKADVVGHSMGVTLARKAIFGGGASDALGGGSYDLGPALTDRVDTFVGIAGGNLGLSTCYFTGPSTPTCGATNGFYPGTAPGGFGLSLFLADLLEHPHEEAGWTGSIWSPDDEILGTGSLTWGVVTARLPEQDGEVVLEGKKHIDLKNAAIPALLQAVSTHTFPAP